MWAIIERDSDGCGFSGVSWHFTKEDATNQCQHLVNVAQRDREERVFYVVSKEKHKELGQLEASGMLYLN
jgi:hypothetical protein